MLGSREECAHTLVAAGCKWNGEAERCVMATGSQHKPHPSPPPLPTNAPLLVPRNGDGGRHDTALFHSRCSRRRGGIKSMEGGAGVCVCVFVCVCVWGGGTEATYRLTAVGSACVDVSHDAYTRRGAGPPGARSDELLLWWVKVWSALGLVESTNGSSIFFTCVKRLLTASSYYLSM
jgi:hypothetical protein